MSTLPPIEVPVHYDFASTLCYVAHRVLGRIEPELGEIGVALRWSPIDLAGLLNWKRGHPVAKDRRDNATRVARELEVDVSAPRYWIDSRPAMAAALCMDTAEREASFRERVFSQIFERGDVPESADRCREIAGELGVPCGEAEFARGLRELKTRTREAADAEVSGLPTLMLNGYPIGGIQSDATMLSLLRRYATRTRARLVAGETLH